MNDVMIHKMQSIQRCIERVKEEFQLAGGSFAQELNRQDATSRRSPHSLSITNPKGR